MEATDIPWAAFLAVYMTVWLTGAIFQWRVDRRIKALAAEEPGRFDVSLEFISIHSVQSSLWLLRYLFQRKYEAIDDAGFQRDCRISKYSLVAVLVLLVAGAVGMSFLPGTKPS